MTTRTLETTKLTPTVGAEVHGVDVERMLGDEHLPGAVLDALEANGVLVFPALHLDDASQVAFSRRLGDPVVLGKGEHPEIFIVTLDPARSRSAVYLKGTFDWHIDGLTDDVPIMATLLAAHEVAETGGETEFASTYAAYDELTDEEKERFESIRVVHTIEATQRRVFPDPSDEQVALWRTRPPKAHPLVWHHRSGRRSLVLGPTAAEVVGMQPEEGQAFLDDLMDRTTQRDRVYTHHWAAGDFVIWDNRGVVHRALPYAETSRRDMHRTTLHGDEAIASSAA